MHFAAAYFSHVNEVLPHGLLSYNWNPLRERSYKNRSKLLQWQRIVHFIWNNNNIHWIGNSKELDINFQEKKMFDWTMRKIDLKKRMLGMSYCWCNWFFFNHFQCRFADGNAIWFSICQTYVNQSINQSRWNIKHTNGDHIYGGMTSAIDASTDGPPPPFFDKQTSEMQSNCQHLNLSISEVYDFILRTITYN